MENCHWPLGNKFICTVIAWKPSLPCSRTKVHNDVQELGNPASFFQVGMYYAHSHPLLIHVWWRRLTAPQAIVSPFPSLI